LLEVTELMIDFLETGVNALEMIVYLGPDPAGVMPERGLRGADFLPQLGGPLVKDGLEIGGAGGRSRLQVREADPKSRQVNAGSLGHPAAAV
jgi:hypothetical protein